MHKPKAKYSIGFNDGHLSLQGAFTFSTVPVAWKELSPMLKKNSVTHLNLTEVTDSDSSLLALLLVIRRLNKKLRLAHLPESLASMSKVNGVLELLTHEQ